MATKKKALKKALKIPSVTSPRAEPEALPPHRDYRLVIASVHDRVLKLSRQPGSLPDWAFCHVETFDDLLKPHPIAELVRALGLYETAHWEAYGRRLAEDGVLGKCWLQAWFSVRSMLNGELGLLDGGACDSVLMAIGRNAGFNDKELS